MQISDKGFNIIKEFEGLQLKPYICPAGKKTIGYGHVLLPTESFVEISETQADILLKRDCRICEKVIASSVMVTLSQNEYDALVSFIFNLGGGVFRKSTLLKKLNIEDYSGAADEFLKWCHIGDKVSEGLIRRRQAEQDLFLKD